MADKTGSTALESALSAICIDYLAYRGLAKTLHSSLDIAKAKSQMRELHTQRVHNLFDEFRETLQKQSPKTPADLDRVLHLLHNAVAEATK